MPTNETFEVNAYSILLLLALPGLMITAVANLGWQVGALGLVLLVLHWIVAVMQWKKAPQSIRSRRSAILLFLSAGIVFGIFGAPLVEALRPGEDGPFMLAVFTYVGGLVVFQLCLLSQIKAGGAKIVWTRS